VPIRFFYTEGFRIGAIFVAVFALAAGAMTLLTLITVDREFKSQIVQFALEDIAAIQDGYRTEGVSEAREVVDQRMAVPSTSDFFLLEDGGTRLAGNLRPMPPRIGTFTLSYRVQGHDRHILGVGASLSRKIYAFSGSDLHRANRAQQHLLYALLWVFAGALAAAVLAAAFVSHGFLRQTDVIVKACRTIMAGDLKARIPSRGTHDELDRLAETINAMLDRIASLMENVKQVTNDIAHDLRTPLTHLRHRLEQARETATTPKDYDHALEGGILAADDALHLFSALLRIGEIEARARRAGFAPLDLEALLKQLRDLFVPVAEDAGHRLEFVLNARACVFADKELLTQLFVNLIENAIVHTPSGTKVTVRLGAQEGCATVVVSDDGPGVPANEHEKLFQRLYRREASRSRPGYGLGLPLVSAIADLHGATLKTETCGTQGFCVRLSLPIFSPAGDAQPKLIGT
jgi:signal transduction histidine kinase